MSACGQCCSCVITPFKLYNEKFRGAYITVFDGICQFLNLPYLELRPGSQSVIVPNLPVIAGDPVTVVKICCDCVTFCRMQSIMLIRTYTTTASTIYVVTIPVVTLSTVLIGVIPFVGYLSCWNLFQLIFLSLNCAMHLLSVAPCRVNLTQVLVLMHTWIGTLAFKNRSS